MADASVAEKGYENASTLPVKNPALLPPPKARGIRPDGESGRTGIHPLKFLLICYRSSCTLSQYVNALWPVVPVALAMHWARPEQSLWNFILPYIAMVPSANLLGFAGQELARKLPHVLGVVLETTFGSIVEIILFVVLIKQGEKSVPIIKGAILGSILANLLLCLGLCFFAGGVRPDTIQVSFSESVSEVGSNLMLVAGMGLVVPAAFSASLKGTSSDAGSEIGNQVLKISRVSSIILLLAFVVYVFFQMHSHKGLYEEVFHAEEEQDAERHRAMGKAKLTMTEAIIALAFALAVVSIMAVFLVHGIEYVVTERGISDAFVGLILVPLVEKAAEHITAVNEAWVNKMNLALSHVLGSSIQTALFNTPLIVMVGWGLHVPMDLNFEIFDAIVLILAILVVGNFLRDAKTDYLEGILCVFVYIIIAIAAFYYPSS